MLSDPEMAESAAEDRVDTRDAAREAGLRYVSDEEQVQFARTIGEIDPIGAKRSVKVDIRLISATNQNLNRDYLKLDQPEMRAVRGLILKYRPDLYVDVHVTDGMDYQYDVTYGFNGEDGTFSRSPNSSAWLDTVFKPAMNAALERQGHIPGELVFGIDDDEPKKGLSDGGLGERSLGTLVARGCRKQRGAETQAVGGHDSR